MVCEIGTTMGSNQTSCY